MAQRPSVIVFDVNETLSDLAPMAGRFADVGAPPGLAATWFSSVLRDGFALAVHGEQRPFAELARHVLRTLLPAAALDRDLEDAVEHVVAGFGELPVHPDVPEGVRALSDEGLRLVTLSNGAVGVAEGLLERAGLRDRFDLLLSVDDAGVWKPARAAYEHAAQRCGVPVSELLLVAVHPWDLDGAARAGLATAWVDRAGVAHPGCFATPTHTVRALPELAAALAR